MTTKTGLDSILASPYDLLRGKRAGLVTNAASVTETLQSNIDALLQAGVQLVALYSPEHGLAGAIGHGEHVASGRDARTGLPVYSLYGETRRPTREMVAGVDILLFDLQDVGARFYTYTSTLGMVLEASAEFGLPLVVLDRPNPIGGNVIEGPVLDRALESSVGYGPIPLRFGLTMGELAQFYNRELNIGAELHVVPLQGWNRGMWFDETGLVWTWPSPNMPHPATTVLYPGICLVEGTNLSAGRGTALPFQVVGAPWLDGYTLAAELNALEGAGVRYRPVVFIPSGDKFAGETCGGVQVHVTDRGALRPVKLGLDLIGTVKRLCPVQFEWLGEHFDLLIGNTNVRMQMDRGVPVDDIVGAWTTEQQAYERRRSAYLLYA